MSLFWLSFCDPDRPDGTQFLGASVVPADSFLEAVRVAHLSGCNPGGEVQGHPIPKELQYRVPLDRRLVLWSREECEALSERWRPS